MLLRERLDAFAGQLTSADRAVLDVLLSHPTESAFLPADRITARANVHVAAATRLAKKLGYAGYPGLRESLQRELLDGVGAADRIRNRLSHAESDDVLASLVSEEAAALAEAVRTVSHADLKAVANQILAARRTLIFAQGNATVLAGMLERRLRRFGFNVGMLGTNNRDLAETLVSLQKGDVVLCIALRRIPTQLRGLLKTIDEVGATSILFTDTLDAQIRPRPNHVLAAARGTGREFQSLTVPMAIANALVLTVATAGGSRAMKSLERLDELMKRFGD
ncbi:MurR/RpiR family transcriptional regulator [Leifsonia bigeumensis]|uniref:MurR/RpiR family transcriptional regulator n=1 Tax=Leifsonella bigeumensis TaxID=433643 RepID=A0ABP7FQ47_9MICO